MTYGANSLLLRQAIQGCTLSILLYGAETWYSKATSKATISKLQITLNKAARAVLPCYKITPTAALLRETGWASAQVQLDLI